MSSTIFNVLLAGMTPPGTQQDPKAQTLNFVFMMVLMGVIFYFALIRPQQKKAKDHANLLKTIRPGDKVVTSGGIVGVVLSVKEKTISLRSADAKLEITKSAIGEITERSGEPDEKP
jgi:preprotein translocase subunit YajC